MDEHMVERMMGPDLCHEHILRTRKPLLSYDSKQDFTSQKEKIRAKLVDLMGDAPDSCDPAFRIEFERERDAFKEIRFSFNAEEYARLACHLWIPNTGKDKFSVVICLQGHTSGMHISMGRVLYEGDEKKVIDGDRDFAVQAVREGYAALCVEQRAFGERKSDIIRGTTTCAHPSMTALLIGRTMMRERVWDVQRAIDMLSHFPCLDTERIAVMGNSSGGTVSYYAACLEERIKMVMPSCSVCTYKDSIGAVSHCTCNYIPGIAKYVDMGDLAVLIAPRPLIVVAGRDDPIFPFRGVEEAFAKIRTIYTDSGHPENCQLVIGEGAHRFYARQGWEAFNSYHIL